MHSSKMFSALLLLSFLAVDAKSTKDVKKLQVVVDPATSMFAMNSGDGGVFVTNPFANRPFGATYLLNGVILPGGTVDKDDSSYLLDKHGNPIADKVIGTWVCYGQVLANLDFMNLSPLLGDTVELITWTFLFNEDCDDEANTISSNGITYVTTNSLDQTTFAQLMSLSVGTGCNDDVHHNHYKSIIYFDANNVQLIKIKFDDEIHYKK